MTKKEIIRFLVLRSIGNFLVLFAIFGIVATFGPAMYYEAQYRIGQIRGVRYTVSPTVAKERPSQLGEVMQKQRLEEQRRIIAPLTERGFADVLTGPTEQILIPKDTLFSVLIPKIGANSLVIPNVDASSENEFLPTLSRGVAHAKGTVFPGQKGNVYLFAHSADNFWAVGRYNAVFYLLKDLIPGDDIVVFFENLRHNYVVLETKVLEASDVSYLVEGQNKDKETLLLQTCWPPGTTWKRLVVIARPK